MGGPRSPGSLPFGNLFFVLVPLFAAFIVSASTCRGAAGFSQVLADGLPAPVTEVTVKTTGQTGVEMEALTAVSVAALTVYDMCKSIDRGMSIEEIRLEEKSGGQSGHFVRAAEEQAPR